MQPSHIPRFLMIALTPNLCAAPSLADPPDCGPPTDPEGLAWVADQQALFQTLGWGDFDPCMDAALLLDQEVEDIPDAVFSGTHGGESFEFTVQAFIAFNSWDSYGLPPETVQLLYGYNAHSAVIIGTLNGWVNFEGVTYSVDDPNGELGRVHVLMIADWQLAASTGGWKEGCNGSEAQQDEFEICMDNATIRYGACIEIAVNNYANCLGNSVNSGIVGGAIGCLVGKLVVGAIGGWAGLARVAAVCGFGFIAAWRLEVDACFNTYDTDSDNCSVTFQAEKDICRRTHCATVQHAGTPPIY